MNTVNVGGASMSVDEAMTFASTYLTNVNSNWAYPAYDGYPGTPGPAVGQADLLAITLLNAGQKIIPSYYGLSSILGDLNERMSSPLLTGALEQAGPSELDAIADVFGVLDITSPKFVGLTKLSKVVHRKRPELLPLYDKNIHWCYFRTAAAPVDRVKARSWSDMARAWVIAVQDDLVSQFDVWEGIAALAPGPQITPLRALDIIGWRLGALEQQ